MKKYIISLLLVLALCLEFSPRTLAASFAVYMSGNEVFEGSTVITVTVGSFDDISGYCQGLCAAVMTLNYDSSKVSVAASALNGFTLTSGSRLVLDRATGVPAGTAILLLNVTNVGLSAGESTTISLTGISGSDSDVNASGGSASKVITLKASTAAPQPEPTAPTPNSSSGSTSSNKTNTVDGSSETAENKTNLSDEPQDMENASTNNETGKATDLENGSDNSKKRVVSITTEDGGKDALDNKGPNLLLWIIVAVILLGGGVVLGFFIYHKKHSNK